MSEVGDEDLPDHQARRSTVVEVVAETAGIPDSAAEEVVGHALHNELLEEMEDGTIVYVPENPGWEPGDSHG